MNDDVYIVCLGGGAVIQSVFRDLGSAAAYVAKHQESRGISWVRVLAEEHGKIVGAWLSADGGEIWIERHGVQS